MVNVTLHLQSSEANTFARAFETVLESETWRQRLTEMRLPRRMTCDVWLPKDDQWHRDHSRTFQILLERHGFTTEQLKELRAKITLDIKDCPQIMWDALNDLGDEVKEELLHDVVAVHQEATGEAPGQYVDVLDMFRIMAIKHHH